MPFKKATNTEHKDFKPTTKRASKPTKQEREAATEMQSPSMRKTVQPPVHVPFDIFRKKMNEGRYQDTPQLEWTNGADLEGVVFYIHRTFKFKTQNGPQVGFELSLGSEDGERRLLSLSMNDERKAFHDSMAEYKRHTAGNPFIGPMTVELVPNKNPAFKPYTRFVEVEVDSE